ncbi:ABC transporter ATP-binding protein [Acidobacteria bacterium AH-259-L09]|nr:ABC transporter ATP-binding protein [Acidobacteria bacterium AH-259-L09]
MSSEGNESRPAIYLKHLSKKYAIYDRPSYKFLELITLRKKQFHREFWALEDIDLEVWPGTTLGIIGQNGSGKSTLLQLVAGILRQTRGDCHVQGNVSALLELGSGFNPEFTGHENVFMNGAIMGLTRSQMEERLERILEFAEIGEFIHQPVKTYSSGMFMRLAFAVAIHVDPDILLIDEALAVGDLIFQHRCTNRIRRLRQDGKTILFVTHDLHAVTRFCDRAILLDHGRKLEDGDPEKVVQCYQALMFERQRKEAGVGQMWVDVEQDQSLQVVKTVPHIHHRYGEGGAEIIGIILHSPEGRVLNQIRARQEVLLAISARFQRDLKHPIIGFTIRDRLGVEITASNTSYEGFYLPAGKAGDVFTVGFRIRVPALCPGSYSISPAVADGNIWEHRIEDWIDNAYVVDLADTGLVYGMMRWSVKASFKVDN